jgi:hypothetical protein
LIGEPKEDIDVGIALYEGKEVVVDIFSGSSVLSHGLRTGATAVIDRVLSPLAAEEVGTIRCIGLNVWVKWITNLSSSNKNDLV